MDSLIEFDGEDLEPVPLRELKDTFREHKNLGRQRDEFEYERSLAQNEVLVARQQVQGLVDRIVQVMGPDVFEQVLGQVRGEQAQHLSKAKAQLLEFYPQWRDARLCEDGPEPARATSFKLWILAIRGRRDSGCAPRQICDGRHETEGTLRPPAGGHDGKGTDNRARIDPKASAIEV